MIENWGKISCVLTERVIWSKWKDPWRLQNMEQNADSQIINIYIYFKPGRIGFWGWPFSVMYAFWLLIVTSLQPERQIVNIFEVNLLMETWKNACEGQSLGGAASNCVLLKIFGLLEIKERLTLLSKWYWLHCAVFWARWSLLLVDKSSKSLKWRLFRNKNIFFY